MARKIGHFIMTLAFLVFVLLGLTSFFQGVDESLGTNEVSGKLMTYSESLEGDFKAYDEAYEELRNPDESLPEEESEYIDDTGRDEIAFSETESRDMMTNLKRDLQSDEDFALPSYYWNAFILLIFTYLGILGLRALLGESRV